MEYIGNIILRVFLRKQQNPSVNKILIIEPFEMGDAAMIAVMLDPLGKRFRNVKIDLLIQESSALLFAGDRRIHKIHSFTFPWVPKSKGYRRSPNRLSLLRFLLLLRAERYDIAIDVRGDVRSQWIAVFLGCPTRVGFTHYLCSNLRLRGLLLTHAEHDASVRHRSILNLDLCRQLGCKIDGAYVPAFHMAETDRMRNGTSRMKILIHPGAGNSVRLWKTERWCELIGFIKQYYEAEIVVIGAARDGVVLNEIERKCKNHVRMRQTSIPEMIRNILESDIFICLDSGPMNIAALYGKTVLALFGPGSVTMYRPMSPGSRVVHRQEQFGCAPCAQICCHMKRMSCMDVIATQDVIRPFIEMAPLKFRKTCIKRLNSNGVTNEYGLFCCDKRELPT